MKQDVGWREILAPLAAGFAARTDAADESDAYVAENFAELRQSGLLAAGVPADLGGMGLGIDELCALLMEVARACPSTGLAYSMHTHQVAVNAWRYRHAKAPVDWDGVIRRGRLPGTHDKRRLVQRRWAALHPARQLQAAP